MIEGNDVVETFSRFEKLDLKNLSGKTLEKYLVNNYVSFYQVFNLIARMTLEMIQKVESSTEVRLTINKIKNLKNSKLDINIPYDDKEITELRKRVKE